MSSIPFINNIFICQYFVISMGLSVYTCHNCLAMRKVSIQGTKFMFFTNVLLFWICIILHLEVFTCNWVFYFIVPFYGKEQIFVKLDTIY